MTELTLAERETHINMTGDDHSTWYVFSDDPVLQRRLERKGHEPTHIDKAGGRHYEIPANLITFRSVPTPEQAEQRRAQAARLRSESQKSRIAGGFGAQNAE